MKIKRKLYIKFVNYVKITKKMVYYEIKVLRELKHKYIMRLHEVYETEEHLVLILEYMKGGTLL